MSVPRGPLPRAFAVAGVVTLIGGTLAAAATVLPLQTFGVGTGDPFTFAILPVLVGGDVEPLTWYALEPVLIAGLAIILGLALLARHTGNGVLAGILIGLGLLGLSNYGSTLLSSIADPEETSAEVGVYVGLAGAGLALAAGLIAAVASRTNPSKVPAPGSLAEPTQPPPTMLDLGQNAPGPAPESTLEP